MKKGRIPRAVEKLTIELLRRADNGESIEKLAKEFGVSKDYIYRRLREYNGPRKRGRKKGVSPVAEGDAKKVREGWTIMEIARHRGVSKEAVYMNVKRAKEEKDNVQSQADQDRVKFEAGWTVAEIARQREVSRQVVHRNIQRSQEIANAENDSEAR